MYTNNKSLVDEALIYEPIKNTFLLGWEWITVNKAFTATALGIYILFNLLGVSFLATIFTIMIQIYIGKIFYGSIGITEFVESIKTSTREKLVKDSFFPAFGAYLGWTLLMFIIAVLLLLLVLNQQDISALELSNLQTPEAIEANIDILKPILFSLAMPSFVLMLIVLYIKPLVEANIIMSQTFKEGFSAVFTIFSFELWKKAMRSDYFTYVLKLNLILIVLSLPLGLLVTLMGLNILTYIVVFVFLYVINIIMAIGSMMLRRMIEQEG